MTASPRPPEDFWQEVPCGHLERPMAWRFDDGRFTCHCGQGLDPSRGIEPALTGAPVPVVMCSTCGCAVGLPQEASSGA